MANKKANTGAQTGAETTETIAATLAKGLGEYDSKQAKIMQKAGADTPKPEVIIAAILAAGFEIEAPLVADKAKQVMDDGVAMPFSKGTSRIHYYYGYNNVGIFTPAPLESVPYYGSQKVKGADGKPKPISNKFGTYRHYCTHAALVNTVLPELVKAK